jgi:uncharacterized membrane protein
MLSQCALPGFHPCLACAAGAADGLTGVLAVLVLAEVGLLLRTVALDSLCLVMGTSTIFPKLMASASIVQAVHLAEAHSQGSGAKSSAMHCVSHHFNG